MWDPHYIRKEKKIIELLKFMSGAVKESLYQFWGKLRDRITLIQTNLIQAIKFDGTATSESNCIRLEK